MDRPSNIKPNSIDRLLSPDQVRQLEYLLFDLRPPMTNAQAAEGAREFWGVELSESAIARFYRRTDAWRLHNARLSREKPKPDAWGNFIGLVRKHQSRPGYKEPMHRNMRPRGGYASTITRLLSAGQQEALERWLLEDGMLCSAAAARAQREFGFGLRLSESSVRRFQKRCQRRRASQEGR
jgi:hypothetical protein